MPDFMRRAFSIVPACAVLLTTVYLCSCKQPSQAAPAAKASQAVAPSPVDHDWQTYTNVRFAYSICYPADLLAGQGESDNSDGQKFLSRDGSVEVLVYGS